MKKIHAAAVRCTCFVDLPVCDLRHGHGAGCRNHVSQRQLSHRFQHSGDGPHTSNVKTQTFGKRSTFAVQGYVYAQPLYVPGLTIGGTSHNVLFVATEHDQVYAFDVNSGQQLWHTNFLADRPDFAT